MAGKSIRRSLGWASGISVLIGAAVLLWSPMAEAQGTFSPAPRVQATQPAKIDRSSPGSKKGILTKAKGGTVWIDGASYALAPDALVENQLGSPVELRLYQWNSVELPVQYWLGTGSADRQITHMIITLLQ
jgi:hypothetical protein